MNREERGGELRDPFGPSARTVHERAQAASEKDEAGQREADQHSCQADQSQDTAGSARSPRTTADQGKQTCPSSGEEHERGSHPFRHGSKSSIGG